jgi:hypothetical protein
MLSDSRSHLASRDRQLDDTIKAVFVGTTNAATSPSTASNLVVTPAWALQILSHTAGD